MAQNAPENKHDLSALNADINRRLRPLMLQVMNDLNEVHTEAARRDPEKHKRSHLMGGDGSARYRYFLGGQNTHGLTTKFCYSVNPNVAGRFLVWRQKEYRNGKIKRDQFSYPMSKSSAVNLARRRMREHRKS